MKSTRTGRARLGLVAGALVLGAAGATARAVVTEPNGLAAPIPVAAAEVGFASGFNPPAVVTLSGLFQARNEQIDWLQDAHTTPAVFSPQCAFTGELVLHGGACKIDFGWYNAVAGSTTPPADSDIYTIIPGSMITNPWHPGVGEDGPIFTTDTIRADPHYKGGLIGFALKGDQGQDCKQTHFSEQALNPLCSGCTTPGHWAAAAVWQSTVTPNAYYIGFEDLPMGPTSTGPNDFGSVAGQTLKCDGDFNDFVYFLSGLTCDGGGTACDTMMPGVCAAGLNECVTGTMLNCKQSVMPSAEVCDGLDNDCNGIVDDKAPCPNTQVCDRGTCVLPCGDSEFPCAPGDECVKGLCVEQACAAVTCDAGQTCKGGACTGPCDGVKCPGGQLCRVGRCVDPCDGVTCLSDRVCEGGVCVPSCKCAGCATGKTCDHDGRPLPGQRLRGQDVRVHRALRGGHLHRPLRGRRLPDGPDLHGGRLRRRPQARRRRLRGARHRQRRQRRISGRRHGPRHRRRRRDRQRGRRPRGADQDRHRQRVPLRHRVHGHARRDLAVRAARGRRHDLRAPSSPSRLAARTNA